MKIRLNTKSVKLFIAAIRAAPEGRLQIAYSNMASLLLITQRSAQKLVKRLEKAGLLKVERSSDQYTTNTYSINYDYFYLQEKLNA